MSEIRVITFRVGKPATTEHIFAGRDGGLSGLKAIVGGWLERVPNAYWQAGPGLDLFCNEDGIRLGLQEQRRPEIGQRAPLYGNLVLARSDADGNTLSVIDADVALYCREGA